MNSFIALVGNLYITGGIVDSSMHNPRRWHATAASQTPLFVFDGVDAGTRNSCEVFSAQTRQYALHYRHFSNK